ncbi:hypothetical protein H5410_004212 [Solanum commersonii]|uniref:Uncharacterized protein n=1 Tax=Solanum commersonii TaxID=4109 RepID=A0A9J6B7U3_SOLCO|nr:hypothetical protein H5410_004212 [Solanum commersonii]
MQSGQLSDCQLGNHHLVLDEKLDSSVQFVHMPIRRAKNRGRYIRKYFGESPSILDIDGFIVSYSSAAHDSPIYGEKTVWYLVPQSAKGTIYDNQQGEFEFTWNHIA